MMQLEPNTAKSLLRTSSAPSKWLIGISEFEPVKNVWRAAMPRQF
jgi:hypothetical protein